MCSYFETPDTRPSFTLFDDCISVHTISCTNFPLRHNSSIISIAAHTEGMGIRARGYNAQCYKMGTQVVRVRNTDNSFVKEGEEGKIDRVLLLIVRYFGSHLLLCLLI